MTDSTRIADGYNIDPSRSLSLQADAYTKDTWFDADLQKVMLHFAKIDAPALPVHDSFIIHHGYAESGEMEEAMRRAFHETFGESIKVSEEIIYWQYRKTQSDTDEFTPLSINQIIKDDDDVSQWRYRHSEWYKRLSQSAK